MTLLRRTPPAEIPAPLPGARYEATTRICTVFFSAVTGLGLSHLLQTPSQDLIGVDTEPCFILALLLILRFLFGSANHLWLEYVVTKVDRTARNFLLGDIGGLVVFGFFALRMCYATTIPDFLRLNVYFGIAAVAVDLLMQLARLLSGKSAAGRWVVFWVLINVVQVVAAYAGGKLYLTNYQWAMRGLGWNCVLTALVGVYAIILVLDLLCQWEVVENRP
jgi:hypothetical protein